MSLTKSLKKLSKPPVESRIPVWEGPGGTGPQGGISQSLLSRFLCCGERFRVMVVEGWRGTERWQPPTGYGDMWHAAEEEHARGVVRKDGKESWPDALRNCSVGACRTYLLQQEEIQAWYDKCRVAFPLYVKHWAEHPDVLDRVPMLQEHAFDYPYKLPSGRQVRLRGKFDAVDLIGKGDGVGVWLQENKTKSRIEEGKIQHLLQRDLQTMLYLVALRGTLGQLDKKWQRYAGQVKGVRYNVVKRPSHYCGKKETREGFMDRLKGVIEEAPAEFFHRWQVTITDSDIARFKRECLDPILENLLDDYEWWAWCYARPKPHTPFDYVARAKQFPAHQGRHFILPFGLYNTVLDGNYSDLDEYLYSGSTVGLERVENLFQELP